MYTFNNANELAKCFEYTNLNNVATEEEILDFLNKSKKYPFHSVVVSPNFIELAKKTLKDTDIKVGTVIGFPFGFETTEMKIANTKIALEKGADEIDMVINLSNIKSENYEAIAEEIISIKEILGDKILKIIIETSLLIDSEKEKISKVIEACGADYIKTSTGFNGTNTFFENVFDINLITKNAPKTKIKVAGGIEIYKEANRILSAGADKIGSSTAYEIVESFDTYIKNEDVKPQSVI